MNRIANYLKSLMLLELLSGMKLTLGYMFKPKYTLNYPFEKTPQSVRFASVELLGLSPRKGDHELIKTLATQSEDGSLRNQATRDPLTQLSNRAEFDCWNTVWP